MNDILWKLFKNTGDLKYYLFMKEIEKDEDELWYLTLKIKEGDYHEPESI